jgi:putative SOS response-associated peptidase YedK
MPRGVLLGEPETLGLPPFERRAGEACLVLARDPASGDMAPAAMRWGLPVPSEPRRKLLALRADRLGTARASRCARCLVPVEGYVQRGVRRSRIRVDVNGQESLAVAALWEDGPGGPAFAIVTTEPNELLAAAHGSMPALLPAALWPLWLRDGTLTPGELALAMRPVAPALLRAQAMRGRAPEAATVSVARQAAEWMPGARMWEPRPRRQPLVAMEGAHALG